MVKWNQHGWSMKEMILLSSILFAFLLLLAYTVIQLQKGLESNQSKNTNVSQEDYRNIEHVVLEAGLDYYNENFDGFENMYVTTSKLIKENYLNFSSLQVNHDKCSGYIKFSQGEPKVYIHCENYKTKGYEG